MLSWIDRYLIDGLMNWSAYITVVGGQELRGSQMAGSWTTSTSDLWPACPKRQRMDRPMIGLLETIVGAPFVAAALLLLIPEAKTALQVVSAVAALISLLDRSRCGAFMISPRRPPTRRQLPVLRIRDSLKLAVDGWGVVLL